MRPSSLPDRRDTGNWLDAACNWLERHPRITCAVLCSFPLIAGLLERAH